MMGKILFFITAILFFIFYWKIYGLIFTNLIPWNEITDLFSLLIIFPLLIVFSIISTQKTFKIIRQTKQ